MRPVPVGRPKRMWLQVADCPKGLEKELMVSCPPVCQRGNVGPSTSTPRFSEPSPQGLKCAEEREKDASETDLSICWNLSQT